MRTCSTCGRSFPETSEHFHKDRNGLSYSCKECARARAREWTRNNADRIREKADKAKADRLSARMLRKAAWDAGAEERRLKKNLEQREWRKNNPGKYSEYCKRWYYSHHEEAKELNRKKYEANPEMFAEKNRRFRAENPDAIAVIKQRRHSRKKALPATLTLEEWTRIRGAFGQRCAYCGQDAKLQQEHFIPLSKGGAYDKTNILPSCRWCNTSKKDKLFEDWYPKSKRYDRFREEKIVKYMERMKEDY